MQHLQPDASGGRHLRDNLGGAGQVPAMSGAGRIIYAAGQREKKKPAPVDWSGLRMRRWRRSTLPPPRRGSTIDADRLNDRVRDGNGCGPVALVASKLTGIRYLLSGARFCEQRIPNSEYHFNDECVLSWWWGITPSFGQRRDQASRAISTARLKRSRALHLPPINLVVSQGPSGALRLGSVHLGEGFPLRCIQRLSPRDIANRRCPWQDSRDTRGRFVRVLSYYGRHPSTLQRPYRIQTELSHDVLNPAHVPL